MFKGETSLAHLLGGRVIVRVTLEESTGPEVPYYDLSPDEKLSIARRYKESAGNLFKLNRIEDAIERLILYLFVIVFNFIADTLLFDLIE